MLGKFWQRDIEIDDVYYRLHHPVYGVADYWRDRYCRKPDPRMMLRAAEEHSVDLPQSILVGDKPTDIAAGRAARAGCCILLRSGYPLKGQDAGDAYRVVADLRGYRKRSRQ